MLTNGDCDDGPDTSTKRAVDGDERGVDEDFNIAEVGTDAPNRDVVGLSTAVVASAIEWHRREESGGLTVSPRWLQFKSEIEAFVTATTLGHQFGDAKPDTGQVMTPRFPESVAKSVITGPELDYEWTAVSAEESGVTNLNDGAESAIDSTNAGGKETGDDSVRGVSEVYDPAALAAVTALAAYWTARDKRSARQSWPTMSSIRVPTMCHHGGPTSFTNVTDFRDVCSRCVVSAEEVAIVGNHAQLAALLGERAVDLSDS